MEKIILVAALLLLQFSVKSQESLLWTIFGQGQMETCNLDGTNMHDFLSFSGSSGGLAVDNENDLIYWTSTSRGQILRTDFGANVVDTIIDGLDEPKQLILDFDNEKIYWTDAGLDKIQRADWNGSNIEDVLVANALKPVGLAYDPILQQLYFSRQGGVIGRISTASVPVDHSAVDTIIITSGFPGEMELDLTAQKIYWVNQGNNDSEIKRSNFDGSQVENLVVNLIRPYGLALDKNNGKMYWTDWGGSFPKIIKKANLDGSEIESVIEVFNAAPYALAILEDFTVDTENLIVEEDNSLKVYPNPGSGIMTISGNNTAILSAYVLSLNGKILKQLSLDAQSFDISELPTGMYFIQINTARGIIVKKIIKN